MYIKDQKLCIFLPCISCATILYYFSDITYLCCTQRCLISVQNPYFFQNSPFLHYLHTMIKGFNDPDPMETLVSDEKILHKVEKILKGSLDWIPSPSSSVKIQIMSGKVCLRCEGKTKLLKTKSLLTLLSNVLPSYL